MEATREGWSGMKIRVLAVLALSLVLVALSAVLGGGEPWPH